MPTMHLRFRPIENFTQPIHWLCMFEREEDQRSSLAEEGEEVWYDALESEPPPDREMRSLEGGNVTMP